MRTRAVIFGAGFGGLELPAELADEADVTLPVRPGPAMDLSGAPGLIREPLPGGSRPDGRLLDDGVPPGGHCRLLGVFAHPDDETFCAGDTFAHYAEQGAEIMVVSATRGQAGQIRDAAAGTRRTIAAVREAELRLACERLGITKGTLSGPRRRHPGRRRVPGPGG